MANLIRVNHILELGQVTGWPWEWGLFKGGWEAGKATGLRRTQTQSPMLGMVPESISSQAHDIGQVARALCLHFLIHLELPCLLTETVNIEVIQGMTGRVAKAVYGASCYYTLVLGNHESELFGRTQVPLNSALELHVPGDKLLGQQ